VEPDRQGQLNGRYNHLLPPLSRTMYNTAEGIDRNTLIISPDETHVAHHPYLPNELVESEPAGPGSSINEFMSTLPRILEAVNVDGQTIDECFTL
jgi:hypothetical protein